MRALLQQTVVGAAVLAAITSPLRADCPCCTADGTQYYVDALHGNDDDYDGLCEQKQPDPSTCGPKRTIQAAINLATAGDVVNILPGEYSPAFCIGGACVPEPTADCITLKGLGEVVVDVVTTANVVSNVDGARIEGISFRSAGTLSPKMEDASHVLVKRCRFTGGSFGLYLHQTENVTIRESLFRGATNRGILFYYSYLNTVDRCTLARNQQAVEIMSAGSASVRNTALYLNDVSSVGEGTFSYSSFFGEQCDPDPTNFCNPDDPLDPAFDPLFIDVDNPDSAADVYYVKDESPLLTKGQDGGPIGAFGQGFHTSKDMSKDEPAQGPTPWGGWIDQDGNAIAASSLVELNGINEVILKDGVTSAAIYSPRFDTGSQFTVIRSIDFAAFEDITLPPSSREIIDAVQNTPRREINIRTSMTSFDQDPSTGPPFEAVDKQVKFRKRAQYVQMELVLRTDGD